MKILRNDRGETLVEVLASILVSALSVTLLFSCIMASSKLDTDAEDLDNAHYGALSAAEEQKAEITPPTETTFTVTIEGSSQTVKPEIDIYGGEGMYSYKGK